MSRAIRSFLWALLSPLIYVAVGEGFGTPGKNSWQETIPAGIAFGLYLGICQFLLIRKRGGNLDEAWPTIWGAAIVVALFFLVAVVLQKPPTDLLLQLSLPMLSGGMLGIAAGATLALWRSRGTSTAG